MKIIKIPVVAALCGLLFGCSPGLPAPEPFGPVPTAQQVEWQKMEYYMFVHFGPNTFTDVEWGDGHEDPRVFAPTAIDCRQWAATARDAGMKAIILTVKHHDGFCLWPSRYSTHTVRESGWQGDVLRDLSEACREYGLKLGVYLSPWDRNHPSYGTPEYNAVFAGMLDEVLGGYGDVFEQWFDGANGEGPNGKTQDYDWPLFHQTVYRHQPDAIIFSDVGPGCRWMGNERGVAGETNWSRLDIDGFTPGHGAPKGNVLNQGNIDGARWVPAEVDVSIRPGWFYSADQDDRVKSVDSLERIWLTSVGRNANLLLNVPPDRRGRIHPIDSTRLMGLRERLDATYSVNLADGAKVASVSSVRPDVHKRFSVRLGFLNFEKSNATITTFHPNNILSPDYDKYWAAPDDVTTARLEIALPEPRTFNRLQLQEYIPLGQRVAAWHAEYWDGAEWVTCAEGTTIGYKRIVATPDITTDRLRIHIDNSLACPLLNGFALFFSE